MWTSFCSSLSPSLPTITTPCRRHASIMCSGSDPLTAAGRILWGRSLPPGPLISAVRSAWSATWRLMMRQLAPSDPSGSYSRPPSPFPSVPPRYRPNPNLNPSPRLHLYAALPCPWAHRALIVRALLGLEDAVPVSIAAPGSDGSWEFSSSGGGGGGELLVPGLDRANGRRTIREVYEMRAGGYDGRATVPMLWDSERREVVCNESYGIIEFFNLASLDGAGDGNGVDLCPPELVKEIEEGNRIVYPNVNNGVYRYRLLLDVYFILIFVRSMQFA